MISLMEWVVPMTLMKRLQQLELVEQLLGQQGVVRERLHRSIF
jgi:hypothetical protein